MDISIVEKGTENVPDDSIRVDIAWELFLPGSKGAITDQWSKNCDSLKNWLWIELGRKAGYMRMDPKTKIVVVCPKLSDAGKELVIRTCSFWSDNVLEASSSNPERNVWIPPVVNVNDIPGDSPLLRQIAGNHHGAFHSLLSPILGSGRSNIRTYTIPEGETFARFHSHTAREELYIVLKGTGSARIGSHKLILHTGDLISKPTGPDLATQLLADQGVSMGILDIEIWPDMLKNSKDVVHYADHGEVDFFGEGWDMMVPSGSFLSASDSMNNYETGYRRNPDGTWVPSDVPGLRKRAKEKETSKGKP